MNGKIVHDYRIKNLIGRGGMADVYLATHMPSNLDVAIKVIPRNKCNARMNAISETRALSACNHPYIVKFFEFFSDGINDYIVQEYLCGGTLLESINKMFKFDEAFVRNIFVQIVTAVQYMHENVNIVHRDIKAENILLDEYKNIRFIDFGFSHESVCNIMTTACGTPAYAAPEMIQGKKYDVSVDVWSMGVLLYSCCYRRFPFRDDNVTALFDKILKNEPALGKVGSNELRDLISKLLEKDPEKRITIPEILLHPWVRNTPMMRYSHFYKSMVTDEMINNILKKAARNRTLGPTSCNLNIVPHVAYLIAQREALKKVMSLRNTKTPSNSIKYSLMNTLQIAGRYSAKTNIRPSTLTNFY